MVYQPRQPRPKHSRRTPNRYCAFGSARLFISGRFQRIYAPTIIRLNRRYVFVVVFTLFFNPIHALRAAGQRHGSALQNNGRLMYFMRTGGQGLFNAVHFLAEINLRSLDFCNV